MASQGLKGKSKASEHTPDRDDSEHHPRGPVGQVLDEDEGHEGTDHDEISLLQTEWALPVDTDHAHNTEVPHEQGDGDVVHGYVVGSQHFSEEIQ